DESQIITHPEGGTRMYERDGIFFKHEGENPTGSFKDRGMTVAITDAVRLGARTVACASTGNTSASAAAYAAQAGLRAIAVVPAGNLGNTSAFGKALVEARDAGWISKMPRLAAIQARGANPFYRSFRENFAQRHRVTPETVATAIRIGDPVSYDKAVAALRN